MDKECGFGYFSSDRHLGPAYLPGPDGLVSEHFLLSLRRPERNLEVSDEGYYS